MGTVLKLKSLTKSTGTTRALAPYRPARDPFQSGPRPPSRERCSLIWIENFLTLRTTRVGVRGYFSDWFQVLSGVPQGSVLGPLLFLLFVNELPSWIANKMRLFADDTKVWAYIRTTENSQSLQKDLDSLTTWSNEWLLHFNPDKCKIMHTGYKFDTKYYMSDNTSKVELQSTSVEKDLGVFTTDSLKASLQCQKSASS